MSYKLKHLSCCFRIINVNKRTNTLILISVFVLISFIVNMLFGNWYYPMTGLKSKIEKESVSFDNYLKNDISGSGYKLDINT